MAEATSKNQNQSPSAQNRSSGSRDKNRNRRRRRPSKGRSKSGSKKGGKETPQKVVFTPQSLVPLGQAPLPKRPLDSKLVNTQKKKYGIVMYDTLEKAEQDIAKIAETAKQFDCLNIVIKAEGPRSHPPLDPYGKLFCGEAWHLIHQRRLDDGWYNEPQE